MLSRGVRDRTPRRGLLQVMPTQAYWLSVEEAERERPAGHEDWAM
jgi:hypothetical protein